jgi:hypothetical protein
VSVQLGGYQSRSEGYGEEKNLLPLQGIEPRFLGHPARSLAAIAFYSFYVYTRLMMEVTVSVEIKLVV